MATYAIEKNVPVPTPAHGRIAVYPFAAMEVGDSFSVPRDKGRRPDTSGDKRQNSVTASARSYAKRHNPTAKFTVRVVDENTVRCWRVA